MTTDKNPKDKLANRVAVVTGGSRGIGAAIAKAFAAEGAAVAAVYHNDTVNAEQTLSALKNHQPNCMAIECDIADESQVRTCVETINGQLGDVDILVNCAGIGGGDLFEDLTSEFWHTTLAVNLTGTFLMTRYCYPAMKAKHWGRIINVSSQMAFSGGVGVAAYCASKAGVIGFTKALAVEAAPFGVLVNGIAPGATQTGMLDSCGQEIKNRILQKIPLGRFGRPEDIAPTAVLLASNAGAFYVGQTLSPNGGDVLR